MLEHVGRSSVDPLVALATFETPPPGKASFHGGVADFGVTHHAHPDSGAAQMRNRSDVDRVRYELIAISTSTRPSGGSHRGQPLLASKPGSAGGQLTELTHFGVRAPTLNGLPAHRRSYRVL